VYVEGRIDRVDVCPNEDTKYVRVIDYKSGNTNFHKDLVAEGLQLQLMVYLESALKNYKDGSTGGIYYFHIKDASAAANLEDFPKEEIAKEVLSKIEKEYKLDGMDVDQEFKNNFAEKLKELCVRLTSGNIDIDPKKYKSIYNSCRYCDYNSICQKEIH
ncbi:MAG: PD-(D/E)XK nuclease family protein, partial [Bacillota bacterium]|nr:PD-(D/E)XK nuclease family protein [Bacillota bacterium]